MDKIFQQLVELLIGAVPTFLIVLFLVFFLRAVFFSPLKKVLAERHAQTGGAKEAAAQSMAAAEKKSAEYTSAVEQAKAEVYRQREIDRQKALAGRAEQIVKSRAAAEERLNQARTEMATEVAGARELLKVESGVLADSIVRTVLR